MGSKQFIFNNATLEYRVYIAQYILRSQIHMDLPFFSYSKKTLLRKIKVKQVYVHTEHV